MTQRFLQLLLALFPASHRTSQGEEMSDALAQSNPRGATAWKEGLSLLGAAARAWQTHLGSRDAIRNSLFFGFLMWFGFLVGIGPVRRAVWAVRGDLPAELGFGPAYLFILGAVLVMAALTAVAFSRALAAGTFIAAIAALAASTTNGEWSATYGLILEVRWLAIPFFAALWFRPPVRAVWHVKAAGFATMVGLSLHIVGGASPQAYAGTLRSLRNELPMALMGLRQYQLERLSVVLAAVAIALILTLPWVLPAAANVVLAPLASAAVIAPFPITVLAVIYVVTVVRFRQTHSAQPSGVPIS